MSPLVLFQVMLLAVGLVTARKFACVTTSVRLLFKFFFFGFLFLTFQTFLSTVLGQMRRQGFGLAEPLLTIGMLAHERFLGLVDGLQVPK